MKAIIWDLDNTIYQSPDGFFDSCYRNAAEFAIAHGYPHDVGGALETAYASFNQHGYCIASFFLDHGIARDAIEPLYVQSVADLLAPCTKTRRFIEQFTGPQMIMSHSNAAWVDAVMRKLDIDHLIPRTHRLVLEDIGFEGKKLSTAPFERAAAILGHNPQDIIIFEDAVDNLRYAKKLGMTTVLVTNGKVPVKQSFIDHTVTRPYDFQQLVKTQLA